MCSNYRGSSYGESSIILHRSIGNKLINPSQLSLTQNENGEPEVSAWERYVGEEYELLVAEEGASQINQEM